MTRVRVLGPKRALRATVVALQELGLLHLSEVSSSTLVHKHQPTVAEQARERRVRRALDVVEAVLTAFESLAEAPGTRSAPTRRDRVALHEGKVAREAHHLRTKVRKLRAARDELREEAATLESYLPLVDEFDALLSSRPTLRWLAAHLLLVRETSTERLDQLEVALTAVIGTGYHVHARTLAAGETVLLLLIPADAAIEAALAASRVERAPIPQSLRSSPLIEALPMMRPRLAEVRRQLTVVRDQARELQRHHGSAMAAARCCFRDELVAIDAEAATAETSRAFVLEGWVPAAGLARLTAGLKSAVGTAVSMAVLGRETWHGADAPVVLSNPRLFMPFERITAMLPLPRYGAIDPSPLVALFFPVLLGVVVGDIGYGASMAMVALALRHGAAMDGARRDLARISGAAAVFVIVFGMLYAECFGAMGRNLFGLHPPWLHKREAVLPFLILALFLGMGHLAIGLALSLLSHWRRRDAFSRGLSLAMLGLLMIALLVVFEQLPAVFFTPAIIGLLAFFPLIIAVEGLSGMFEFLSIFGRVLSYARIVAVGTASVILAVVANRMVGPVGSAAVGLGFAGLFHLVNFAVVLFSPTIHLLRLRYLEFFSTFFSPRGANYHPLAHWTPAQEGPS